LILPISASQLTSYILIKKKKTERKRKGGIWKAQEKEGAASVSFKSKGTWWAEERMGQLKRRKSQLLTVTVLSCSIS
jgi:hypothetical protein